VLYPTISEKPTPEEKTRLDRVMAVSRYFGGHPRAASAAALSEPMPLPTTEASPPIAASVSAPRGVTTAPKKKKKEGC
jgi:hypothetical protein